MKRLLLLAIAFVVLPMHLLAAIELRSDFEGGNLGGWLEVAPGEIQMEIRRDTNNAAFRWYSFRMEGAAKQHVIVRIMNAGKASAPEAWEFNQPVVSSDSGRTWGRVTETKYENGIFAFQWDVQSDSEWFALLYPYPYQKWVNVVKAIKSDPRMAKVETIGKSLQGRPIEFLTITAPGSAPEDKPSVWITARVHAAETGASWKLEGLLQWLLSDDPEAKQLLDRCTFYVVGMLNPDGVDDGNYRMNSVGANLNREWDSDDHDKSPTIIAVKKKMTDYVAAGGEIRFYADLHCFSSYRKNFFYYTYDENAESQADVEKVMAFMQLFESINPDFSTARSEGSPGNELGVAKNWVFTTLHVPAVTFETSYEDINYGPGGYMTITRYKKLGADLGRALGRFYFADAGKPAEKAGAAK